MAQSLVMAIEDDDAELIERCSARVIHLEREGSVKTLDAEIALAVTKSGVWAALVMGEKADTRRLARKALRQITSTVRLDIP